MSSPFPSIPEPSGDTAALLATIRAMKQTIELLTGQSGNPEDLLNGFSSTRHTKSTATPLSLLRTSVSEAVQVASSDTSLLAERTSSLEVSVSDAASGATSLAARIHDVDQARIDGDSAIATRTGVVETEVSQARDTAPNLASRVTSIDTASRTRDTTLATSITTVSALANSATANGQVKLSAVAAPSGYSAAFEVKLVASGYSAGMQILAGGAYGSAVLFNANNFFIYDGSTADPVFSITGGNVHLRQEKILEGDVTTGASTDISGNSGSIVLDVKNGSRVVIRATYQNSQAIVNSNANFINLYVNGNLLKSGMIGNMTVPGSAGSYTIANLPTPFTAHYIATADGPITVSMSQSGPVALTNFFLEATCYKK